MALPWSCVFLTPVVSHLMGHQKGPSNKQNYILKQCNRTFIFYLLFSPYRETRKAVLLLFSFVTLASTIIFLIEFADFYKNAGSLWIADDYDCKISVVQNSTNFCAHWEYSEVSNLLWSVGLCTIFLYFYGF